MRSLLRLVATIFFRLFPVYSKGLIGEWQQVNMLPAYSKVLYRLVNFAYLREYYSEKTSIKRRLVLRDWRMKGKGGLDWANMYALRGFHPTGRFADKEPRFLKLEEFLTNGQVSSAHFVGVSSGQEVAYYARRFPEIKFIGTDLDVGIIDACKERWHGIENLAFNVAALEDIDQVIDLFSVDITFASGVLNCLDQPTLVNFFQAIHGRSKIILLGEPVLINFIMDEHNWSTPRGDLYWNHPYTLLLRQAGWQGVDYDYGVVETSYWAKQLCVWGWS